MTMTTLIGISGSLRTGSYNSALLRAAASMMPAGSTMHTESLAAIPLYNGDLESASSIPEPVRHLKDELANADGLLLASPEYNHGVPGVAKNAIDWLSRPAGDIRRVFGGLPVALAGASQGGFGTILGQNAWLPVFHTLGAAVWPGASLMVSRAASVFDEHGAILSDEVRENVRKFVEAFVSHIRSQQMDARAAAAS